MAKAWLDEIEAQADSSAPYYLPRLISEIRDLQTALDASRKALAMKDEALEDADAFLRSVEWVDNNSEDWATNVRHQISEALK